MKENNQLGITDKQLKEMGQRIQQLRKKRKLSQKELADLCEFPSGSRIGGYELGERCPTFRALNMLAKVLETTVAYLRDGLDPLYKSEALDKMGGVRMTPVLTPYEAYYWRFRMDEYKKDSKRKFIALPAETNPNIYLYTVDNDENTASIGATLTINQGELLAIDPDREAQPNNLVAFIFKDNKATKKVHIRRLTEISGKFFLKSLNDTYPLIEFDEEDIQIVGVAISKSIELV